MPSIRYVHRRFEDDHFRLTVTYGPNPLVPEADLHECNIFYLNPGDPALTYFECGHVRKPDWFIVRDRVLPRLLFKYVLAGGVDYNGTPMGPGDLVFLAPGTSSTMTPHAEGVEVIWCTWQGVQMEKILENTDLFRPNTVYHLPAVAPQLQTLFSSVIYNPCLESVDMTRFVRGFTDTLLAYLPAIGGERTQRAVSPLVARAQRIIDTEYRSISVESLAARLYVDPCHLTRAFRRELGLTTKQYQTRTRLSYAEFYLTSTDNSVTQIAESVGYGGYTAFYLAFRQAYGCSPEEYRRRARN